MKNKTHTTESGIALLFVILVTSVLLTVAIGISNIAYKELVFAVEARDSDIAFFAADTGLECGLYWDQNQVAQGAFLQTPAITSASCAGVTFPISGPAVTTNYSLLGSGGGSGPPTSYQYEYTFILPTTATCSKVIVDKLYDATGMTLTNTTVSSYGYNVNHWDASSNPNACITPTESNNTNIVNRALQVTYTNS